MMVARWRKGWRSSEGIEGMGKRFRDGNLSGWGRLSNKMERIARLVPLKGI